MAYTPLKSPITATGINQIDLHAWMLNVTELLNEVTLDYIALKADMANRIANHNTLRTKLNADGGVTDADYAAATAITATTITASYLSMSA